MYSDQPTIPSSVVILRNELTRQPASQCRSSTLTIFIGDLLEKTFHVTRCPALRPGCHRRSAASPTMAAASSPSATGKRHRLPVGSINAGGHVATIMLGIPLVARYSDGPVESGGAHDRLEDGNA